MIKYFSVHTLFLMFVLSTSCKGQGKTVLPKDTVRSETKAITTSYGPNSITRTIEQDRSGHIWIATFQGVFKYNGKSFTNMTSEVSSARFFSVLEDSKGNFWLGSIGSGVYYYDGKSFQNFTTRDGLVNNEITSIYEDNTGHIWFGVNGGISRFDGTSFQNYIMDGDSIIEDRTGKTYPDFTRPPNEVTSIIEDKTGRFWFGTRGNTFVYDARLPDGQGKTFTAVTHNGKPFKNVRTIIEDSKGNIWLGGNDGLWRYDPSASLRAGASTFTNFTEDFVGYIMEDRKGNIWTSSHGRQGWVLSRYDEKSLSHEKPAVTVINPNEGRMLFGILEANDGSIWFGSGDGVYRYDARLPDGQGKTITDFKNKDGH